MGGAEYTVRRCAAAPDLRSWENCWQSAATADIACPYAESKTAEPRARAKLLYDAAGIYGVFQVADRYVRAEHMHDQENVCEDSCVEFFVRPASAAGAADGYFNLEFNCIGTLHCAYRAAALSPDGRREKRFLTPAECALVRREPSFPHRTLAETDTSQTWTLGFFLPFALMAAYTPVPARDELPRVPWTCGFFNCADKSSHPHWLSWRPHPRLCFHLPECFGVLRFA